MTIKKNENESYYYTLFYKINNNTINLDQGLLKIFCKFLKKNNSNFLLICKNYFFLLLIEKKEMSTEEIKISLNVS